MTRNIYLDDITFSTPSAADTMAVWRLIRSCPPLDENSSYCNALQCSHFSNTGIAAKHQGQLLGFISGYIPPTSPESLFVWQVAVGSQARGIGLARAMLLQLWQRLEGNNLRFIETTVAAQNEASRALFHSVAKELDSELDERPWLDQSQHFDGEHDSEPLIIIGPIGS